MPFLQHSQHRTKCGMACRRTASPLTDVMEARFPPGIPSISTGVRRTQMRSRHGPASQHTTEHTELVSCRPCLACSVETKVRITEIVSRSADLKYVCQRSRYENPRDRGRVHLIESDTLPTKAGSLATECSLNFSLSFSSTNRPKIYSRIAALRLVVLRFAFPWPTIGPRHRKSVPAKSVCCLMIPFRIAAQRALEWVFSKPKAAFVVLYLFLW